MGSRARLYIERYPIKVLIGRIKAKIMRRKMQQHVLEEAATSERFDEEAYLRANPDVAAAVKNGQLQSGRQHFELFGRNEGRRLHHTSRDAGQILEAKKRKLQKILPLLRDDLPHVAHEDHFDFLTDDLRNEFNITDTDNVSSHGYDDHVMQLIQKHSTGVVLDIGAGRRPVYFDNVVNFEIALYDTTDVRGVGECLPFKDNSVDGIISIAVLEHVKDPFLCAAEISRILKPGGDLICCVPFLQPLHAYPNHYYNMTHEGLRNLFTRSLVIDQIAVYDSVLPIWSLTWILRSWADGLKGKTKEEFLKLTVAELLESGEKYLDRSFVRELSAEKNLELASACVLFAHKGR